MLYQRRALPLLQEIKDQPRLWKELLERLGGRKEELGEALRAQRFGQVVYVGCGASYNAALSAARVTHLVSGLTSIAVPSSEVLYARRPHYDVRIKTLIVALSRTGETSETVWALEKLRSLDARAVALSITARPGSLEEHAHHRIHLEGAEEEGPIATRTQTSMLLASLVLVSWLSGKQALWDELTRIPDLVHIDEVRDQVRAISTLMQPQFVAFLGSGPYYGVAAEAALKLREMAAVPAEYQYYLEYRHGSQCSLNNLMMVVGLVSDTFRASEEKVTVDLATTRAVRVIFTEKADEGVKMRHDHVIELASGVSEVSRILVVLPALQLMAYEMALARGVNPERPRHAQHVIKLDKRPGV